MDTNTSLLTHLFTVSEVAEAFRLTEAAIRRLIRVKKIPAIRIGKEYRIPEQVVHNILNPINESTATDAGFGLFKGKKHPEGSVWVEKNRQKDKRSLNEILNDLETQS
ncbi:MAG TPA: hypothetical protein DDW49_02990 [Deltaproteobacteria bacterium]|nr:MAG: hypothetical protein A2048_04940 [Deltaproteobacteria bacterium GWA2_45_12]HBF12346.1 hypothetical protein [Deltaproteobacteria bacterium]